MIANLPSVVDLSSPSGRPERLSMVDPKGGPAARVRHVITTSGPSIRMWQAPRHVGQPRQEDGVELMMVVRLEDELVPEARFPPVLQNLSKPSALLGGRQADQRLAQVGRPVRLAEARQD